MNRMTHHLRKDIHTRKANSLSSQLTHLKFLSNASLNSQNPEILVFYSLSPLTCFVVISKFLNLSRPLI